MRTPTLERAAQPAPSSGCARVLGALLAASLILSTIAAGTPANGPAGGVGPNGVIRGKSIKPINRGGPLTASTAALEGEETDTEGSEEVAGVSGGQDAANATDGSHHLRRELAAKIKYHGGAVMKGPVSVYLIFYGKWGGDSGVSILTDLASTIGGSPFYNIQTTYPGVVNTIRYGGSWTTSAIYGNRISDNNIFKLVTTAITTNKFPLNTNGVYFVLTSAEVTASSGFCSDYCAWHWYGTLSGKSIKFAYVGNAVRCISACGTQGSKGPNGNPGADAMATSFAHELNEAVTDPEGTGWYFDNGDENADYCVNTYGGTYAVANGALANMKLGQRHFLLEQNWANTSPAGSCRKAYP